jgi:hypothetical protein
MQIFVWKDLVSRISGMCGMMENLCGRYGLEIRRTREERIEMENGRGKTCR